MISIQGDIHASPLAVGSHGRILLEQLQMDGRGGRVFCQDSVGNASSYVFEQLGRYRHFALDDSKEVGIGDCSVEVVVLEGMGEVSAHFEVDGEVGSYLSLLFHHAVIGIEP